ncbi:MAG: ABC transporter permease [Tenericutes bacterium]|nr:ABC transporter permease [Mycoplasmatota bacterium]
MNKRNWDKFSLKNFSEFKDVDIDGQNSAVNEDSLFKFVELDEFKSEVIKVEPYSYWKSVMRTFIRKPSALIAIISMLLLLLAIIVIPMFTPEGFLDFSIADKDLPPDSVHLWGTDLVGRDLFFMTWTGARKSIGLALITSSLVVVIGTGFGLIWGFYRKLDPIFIELYNLIANIPALLLYMLLSYVLSQAFPAMAAEVRLIISLTIASWIGVARFIRNQTLIITNREYNLASKTLGTPPARIMTKNLLPYLLSVIITQTSLIIPGMISSEVAMSFFGVGLPSNAISLGALLDLGRQKFELYPFQLLAPAGVLSFIIFTFFLFGLALTDALDPKKHR